MTKKISLAALLFFTVWFINSACKKSTATTTGGPTINNNISSNGDPTGTFSGLFLEDNSPYEGLEVQFYNTPIPFHLSTTYPPQPTGTVTAVYYNNNKLVYDSTGFDYYDTAVALISPPIVWTVNGNTNIPSFTYTCTTAFPTYSGANLPSVINRSQNLTIPITGATGYDQIIITLSDTVGYTTANLAASASATSLVCVKDTLTKLTPTHYGNISVTLYKYNPQNLGGKNYLFITTTTYNKLDVVIQ